MAKARAIDKRRKVVQNIRKITRTMQLIATAKYQATYSRATATKPYTEGISQLVEQLSRGEGPIDHPLLAVNSGAHHSAVIVITSNRGLCGGYNAALLRTLIPHLQKAEEAGDVVDVHMIGKKGVLYCEFLGRELASAKTDLDDNLTFADIEPIATAMIDAYERKELDAVHVVYTKFVSTGLQYPEVMQLLPVSHPGTGTAADGGEPSAVAPALSVQYEFTPPAPELLAELLPEMVRVRLFQCFTDALVSEHTARMVAMKAATDAATDMIKTLAQRFNRARQSQITLELLDIVGGAEALA